ncbi:bifunctional folylpolyglutamate synthase/dihydrofolate synthase [Alicyclobacillus fastidiosus]|uniref:tetrahydrofolate synthase n=1 Tax=Alicyclobacillus fastidiosus TaxID=392011 RepID=A0ABV5AFX0_9BACL|nr:folylpolyglutamate synthase/dihydrofolate synthase family protein [Alicyclobacillus fastidiosus]WEH11667.1 bifunctional folylpolyglutamate synthase/dihydrofolate synthase [Alicyclobacillus fastidiosus]
MNVSDAFAWIGSLRRFGIKPGLERVERVLDTLSNPQDGLRFYHVAGTNGKGSVCAMLCAMSMSAGYKTGLYTSPGFEGFNGRISVNQQAIDDESFARYATTIKQAIEQATAKDPLTEFEVLTVMALLYFRDQAVDAVVWETGLGGRYDATSVVHPVVTAITNVSYDHVEILGPTLADIAYDKAGIIKPGVPIVTGAQGEAYGIIEKVAETVGAPLFRIDKDVELTRTAYDDHYQTLRYKGIDHPASEFALSLFGRHQVANAAVALLMFELAYPNLEDRAWERAVASLRTVRWPLRFEVFDHHGIPVVLDGAHNPAAARTLATSLNEFSAALSEKPLWHMVIGVFGDKDARSMFEEVLPLAQDVVVCRPNHVRGADPEAIKRLIGELAPHLSIRVVEQPQAAVQVALQGTGPLVIWGNLHMVEDARKAIAKLEMNYWT